MKPIRGGLLSAVGGALLVLLLITATALAVTGDLYQPPGRTGCVSQTGAGSCADGHGLDGPDSVTVSPDGKSVYVTSEFSDAVARLNRNPTTGAITQPAGTAGCISETGAGPCADGHGLNHASSVAVSPDGKSVYVGASGVVRLNRNTTTGAITQPAGTAGCISETGAGPCADGHALMGADSVAVSSNGKSVYAASYQSNAVVRLNRNTTTGAITQPAGTAGCISETGAGPCADGHGLRLPQYVTASPDGKSVYVASLYDTVARFWRNTTTGAIAQPAGAAGCISDPPYGAEPCANGHALDFPLSVAVAPGGKSVYVASLASNAVARLNRNPSTGAITQPVGVAGCISEGGGGPCADGHALYSPFGVAVSPDGKSLYVASSGHSGSTQADDAVARINRNTTTGAITQPTGAPGCVSETGAGPCADGHALYGAGAVAVSADGKSVYVASYKSDAVTRLNRAP